MPHGPSFDRAMRCWTGHPWPTTFSVSAQDRPVGAARLSSRRTSCWVELPFPGCTKSKPVVSQCTAEVLVTEGGSGAD